MNIDGHLPGTCAALGNTGRVLAVRMGPGEDVLDAMTRIVERAGIRAGIIISGVASLTQLTVRNIHRIPTEPPITTADRHVTTVPGPLEVLSVQGNLAWTPEGELIVHCHLDASVGDPATHTFGGHLVEGTIVATTLELFILEVTGASIERVVDPATGTPELAIAPE